MDSKTLIEERVKLFEENKALLDRASADKRTLTGEEQQEFDRKDARVTELRATLDAIYKSEQEERALAESRGRQTVTVLKMGNDVTDRDRDMAFRAWAMTGKFHNLITRSMVAASDKVGLSMHTREIEGFISPEQRASIMETRALSIGTTDAGGYSVADEAMRAFVEPQKWFGSVRSVATVLQTSTGAPLPIPTVSDLANVGEIIAEAGAVTTTADPVFGLINLGAFKYSSKAVIVSVELLQDSSINLPQYLGRALGERIARIQNTHYTVGTGTTQPWGVATRASLGKTAAATNAITFDEIIDLQHSVDIAYRNRPGTAFMMHDAVAAVLRKTKDTGGQYLWEVSLQLGMPDRALGKSIIINNDMSSTFATNNRLVLFGDFGAYYIREAGPVIFIRADELRVLNHQVVFLAFQRTDGDLTDTTAVKYLRTA